MYIFLAIFFTIVGLAGLYYQVDAGVMAGLGLLPWQFIRMKTEKYTLLVMIIATLAGIIYFILTNEWLLAGLFLLVQLYNYRGYLKSNST